MKFIILICTLLTACGQYHGPRGEPGPAGSNGHDGRDATPTHVVQFCAGYAPSYPSTFPEDGICIAGKLYGVYSAPGNVGLVEMPPGRYTTTMTNAPCSFTVGANCQVTQ